MRTVPKRITEIIEPLIQIINLTQMTNILLVNIMRLVEVIHTAIKGLALLIQLYIAKQQIYLLAIIFL